MDVAAIPLVMAGALLAGLVSGLAGFGTGLVAAGLWFHLLPADMVPPLVALTSVAGQLVGFAALRKSLDWRGALPYLAGGVVGVPMGVALLALASPNGIRLAAGFFLLAYAGSSLAGLFRHHIDNRGGRSADGVVGLLSGVLGGFAGLSGALPLVWLQMRGGEVRDQRAIYQPFNLVILSLAALVMLAGGQFPVGTWTTFWLCLPMTLIGAWVGTRLYARMDDRLLRRIVLVLLCLSGLVLVVNGLR